MSDRLADIEARIHGVRQLGTVVNAMHLIAAARAQRARGQLAAVDAYSQTLAAAIGRALALALDGASSAVAPPDESARTALVVFGVEQGFVGAFGERVLDAVQHGPPAAELFLVGTRAAALASGRGMAAVWQCALPSHPSGIPRLADHICEALYRRIGAGAVDRLDVVFGCRQAAAHGPKMERRRLFPVDLPANPADADRPITNLAPAALVTSLSADYLHALLCHAALHAFAVENEMRMEAMAAARSQSERQLAELEARRRRLRQEQITAEIIELAAGASAASRRGEAGTSGWSAS